MIKATIEAKKSGIFRCFFSNKAIKKRIFPSTLQHNLRNPKFPHLGKLLHFFVVKLNKFRF